MSSSVKLDFRRNRRRPWAWASRRGSPPRWPRRPQVGRDRAGAGGRPARGVVRLEQARRACTWTGSPSMRDGPSHLRSALTRSVGTGRGRSSLVYWRSHGWRAAPTAKRSARDAVRRVASPGRSVVRMQVRRRRVHRREPLGALRVHRQAVDAGVPYVVGRKGPAGRAGELGRGRGRRSCDHTGPRDAEPEEDQTGTSEHTRPSRPPWRSPGIGRRAAR